MEHEFELFIFSAIVAKLRNLYFVREDEKALHFLEIAEGQIDDLIDTLVRDGYTDKDLGFWCTDGNGYVEELRNKVHSWREYYDFHKDEYVIDKGGKKR